MSLDLSILFHEVYELDIIPAKQRREQFGQYAFDLIPVRERVECILFESDQFQQRALRACELRGILDDILSVVVCNLARRNWVGERGAIIREEDGCEAFAVSIQRLDV